MRKLDYDKPFSEEDVAWIRQAALLNEEQIARHQARFDAEVPEVEEIPDEVTRSALDPTARRVERVETGGGPVLVDPTQDPASPDSDGEEDDYDTWPKDDLDNEVAARNRIAENSDGAVSGVEVVGTGKNDAILKADLIKGLRLWDQENSDALKD